MACIVRALISTSLQFFDRRRNIYRHFTHLHNSKGANETARVWRVPSYLTFTVERRDHGTLTENSLTIATEYILSLYQLPLCWLSRK